MIHPLDMSTCLFAVADGAGSCRRSDEGAQFAVEAARAAAEQVFGGGVSAGFGAWSSAVDEFARHCLDNFDRRVDTEVARILDDGGGESAQQIHGSFATTLLAMVANPPHFAYISVGDCFLVVDREPGGPRLVVAESEREHANVTTFLTSSARERNLRSHVIIDHHIDAVALCSDGLVEGMLTRRGDPEDGMYVSAPPEFRLYFRYFAGVRANSDELAAKLSSADFARTSNDDKTMILAVRGPAENPRPGGVAVGGVQEGP